MNTAHLGSMPCLHHSDPELTFALASSSADPWLGVRGHPPQPAEQKGQVSFKSTPFPWTISLDSGQPLLGHLWTLAGLPSRLP